MGMYKCKQCGGEFKRSGTRVPVFCSIPCKAVFQRESKGFTEAWLRKKYVDEGLSTYEIAKIVNRNPKRVYEWLVDYGIKTRTRSETLRKNSWWALGLEHHNKGGTRSPATKAKISKSRKGKKYPKLQGKNNGMYGRKGKLHPNWKGGHTPYRQAFYSSIEWKNVVRTVWGRDRGECCRCSGIFKKIHIHHVISFSVEEKRTDMDNLVTLCAPCHWWVHSKENVDREFICE